MRAKLRMLANTGCIYIYMLRSPSGRGRRRSRAFWWPWGGGASRWVARAICRPPPGPAARGAAGDAGKGPKGAKGQVGEGTGVVKKAISGSTTRRHCCLYHPSVAVGHGVGEGLEVTRRVDAPDRRGLPRSGRLERRAGIGMCACSCE